MYIHGLILVLYAKWIIMAIEGVKAYKVFIRNNIVLGLVNGNKF